MSVHAPVFVTWMCTRRCNLRCEHCYVGVTGPSDRRGEPTTEQGRALIDQLARADVCLLSFAGAEPLLREDIFELASYARGLGLTVVTSTNGICVTDDVVRRLRAAGFGSLQISVDGASADVHDRLRGSGSFERARAAIDCCGRGGLPITIAIAVHRFNFDDLPRTIDLARSVGVTHVKLQPVLEPGHRLSGPTAGLSAPEAMAACSVAERSLDGTGVKLSIASWAALGRERSRDPSAPLDCSEGFEVGLVYDDGSVGSCEGGRGYGSSYDGRFLESWRAAVRAQMETPTCACTPFIQRAARVAA